VGRAFSEGRVDGFPVDDRPARDCTGGSRPAR
jgi:hypothetical protein